MDKRTRLAIRAAKAREAKFQALAFDTTPEGRKERAKMLDNRLWQERGQPNMASGHGASYNKGPKAITARGKGKCGFTYKDYQK